MNDQHGPDIPLGPAHRTVPIAVHGGEGDPGKPICANCGLPYLEHQQGEDGIIRCEDGFYIPSLAELAQLQTRRISPQRRYLPTLSDLVDRLTIVQLKAVFIPEHKDEYVAERALIEHDIDLILAERHDAGERVTAADIHAIIVIMLANRFIWENESKARAGGSEQDKLLKATHSINGVRAAAKNQLARLDGGRKDFKIDALAADLPLEFGNWRIFGV